MLELLAHNQNRQDEKPNIELAEKLCNTNDIKGINEIVSGLYLKSQDIVNDCIKVLYEIGYRKPELIAEYADDFVSGLTSKNNRIVWGCMTALAAIVSIKADTIITRLPEIVAAYKKGSVITVDNSISVFAGMCKTHDKEIFPILINHLKTCRAKEIPQHAERMLICINDSNKETFINTINSRLTELTESQSKRIQKLFKNL